MNKSTSKSTRAVEKILGYEFKDALLLETALTHSSAAEGHLNSNERLEFLGDRVLGVVVAQILYNKFENENEGSLARRFAALTSRDALAEVAGRLGIDGFIETSPTDSATSKRGKQTLLADTMEALLGSLFLDGGLEVASGFIAANWDKLLNSDINPPKDAKTALQEWTQANGLGLPEYSLMEQSGPDHAPIFTIALEVSGHGKHIGKGSSRRNGEMDAAESFLRTLKENK
ncbi:MAG: ribonuclease III [Rhodospirillaceae bacterium]|nr:ribonuclease III [Rhodospirillaceae bacterium]